MKISFRRYDSVQTLQTLSQQTLSSIALWAVVRGLIMNILIQSIAFLGGMSVSTLPQSLLLVLIFSLSLGSIDVIEKYWAQQKLRKR